MDSRYRGAQPPPRGVRSDIVRVTTCDTRQFCILSKNVFGQYVHWYGGRSHECAADSSQCNGCLRQWPRKWLGYLYVHEISHEQPVFLELTRRACELLWAQAPQDENLRGVQVRISKTKGGSKGRYLVNVLERRVPDEHLTADKDPVEVLRYLWRCKNQHVQKPETDL